MERIELKECDPAGSHTVTGGDDLAGLSLAQAIGQAHGGGLADGLRIQRQRVESLRDPASPEALAVLGQQLALLEALFQRFAADALSEGRASVRGELLRGALQAQQAYSRTFALVRALAPPVRVLEAVAVAAGARAEP